MSLIHVRPVSDGRTWRYVSVQMNAGTQTIYNGACVFGGIMVSNGLSANTVKINDGTTLLTAVAPSAPAGTVQIISPSGVEIKTRLVVEPEAGAAGRITVLWQSLSEEQAQSVQRVLVGELRQAPPDNEPPPEPAQHSERGGMFRRSNRK